MASLLTYASVDPKESDSLLRLILNNRHDIVRSDPAGSFTLYFIEGEETAAALDILRKTLALRGVEI